jgi:hypothetical protein
MINNGNHYHPTDGVFVAPKYGVYMFSWNTLTFNTKSLYTELRVENEVKGAVASIAGSDVSTQMRLSTFYFRNLVIELNIINTNDIQ